MAATGSDLDRLAVNTIRTLSIDMVQKADSGHPGLPLGAAPMAYVLWSRHLKHDPSDPRWPDRDRFVLSAGHGSALLYSLLHLFGYDLTMDDVKSFRQWGSRTPGHPEAFLTPGVEATTGPLGQGTANAVGMALAERALAHRFNRAGDPIVDHHTYAIVSDGDLMEGISSEAASIAGHLRLGKLVYLYDSNDVSLDGPLSMAFSEDVAKRYEACGWHVLKVEDGDHDLDAIDRALQDAKAETARPSLIIVTTTIGFGSPNKAGTSEAHGSPLGVEEVAKTKAALGWSTTESFFVPDAARPAFAAAAERGRAAKEEWTARFDAFASADPDLAAEWRRGIANELPSGFADGLTEFPAGEKVATRKAAGVALNDLAKRVPAILGGDADLSGSTNTSIKGAASFDGATGAGRNIHFGVREHAMGAITNGMAFHAGLRPYTATFFVFSDYMRPAIRLAALNHLPVVFVFTHDSVALGEDGPTHQPVEHLMSLRVMPNLDVVRPADANEAAQAWRYALERTEGPTALVLSRQGLETLDRTVVAPASELSRGGYVLAEAVGGAPAAVVIGTGSEVGVALAAKARLEADGVPTRVVSMPCCEAFDRQDETYRRSVLPSDVPTRVAVEAGATRGWERYVGDRGAVVGLDRFGASAPGGENLTRLGVTADAVVDAVKRLHAQQ